MARNGKDAARSTREEIERYRRAAVDYLVRIRKDRIARAIQKNRTEIRQRMTDGRT